ncbi:UNVERIFIED_CONTAM: hypothetical protein FKN15_000278 [Acipenser sinensis]
MPLSKEELEIVMRAIKDVMEEVELDVTDKGVKLPRGPLPEYIKCADVRNCWIGDKLNQTVLWCQKPKGLRAGAVVLKSWGNCMNMSQLENCPYWNPQDGLVRIIEESGRRMKGKRSVEGTDGPGSTQRGTPLGGSLATRYPTATDSPSGNKEGNGSFHGTMINGTNPMTRSSAAPSGPPGFPTSTFSSPMPTTDTTSRIRGTNWCGVFVQSVLHDYSTMIERLEAGSDLSIELEEDEGFADTEGFQDLTVPTLDTENLPATV